jgi:hypothetical protein
MIVASTVTLLVYLSFLIVQNTLYTTLNNDGKDVPWACSDLNIAIIKVVLKLEIAASFMLDKYGRNRKECALISFAIASLIAFKRFKHAHSLNQTVQFAQIIYETLTAWLFFSIAVNEYASAHITLMNVLCIYLAGILLSVILALYSSYKSREEMLAAFQNTNDEFGISFSMGKAISNNEDLSLDEQKRLI